MGRQHTIYLSDESWDKLMTLKQDGQSMSEVIRRAIVVALNNAIDYNEQLRVEALRTQVKIRDIVIKNCRKCSKEVNLE